jgi:hypothetical protein
LQTKSGLFGSFPALNIRTNLVLDINLGNKSGFKFRTHSIFQRLFEPREGQMLVFPSFEFHRTIPFENSQQRINIGLDLLVWNGL